MNLNLMNLQWSGGTNRSSQTIPSLQVAIMSSTRPWTLFTSWNHNYGYYDNVWMMIIKN